jgi:hypothetical protein
MIPFYASLLLGNYFEEIKNSIDYFENFYLGMFISELSYKTEEDGINRKKKYYKSVSGAIKDINKKIKHFNHTVKELNKEFSIIKEIDLSEIKKIIFEHKGDYPKSTGPGSCMDELKGISSSPSGLSRRHTVLLIHNIIFTTKQSMAEFGKSVIQNVKPFECINKKKIRSSVKTEIDKIEAIYSIGGLAEAIFVLGRLLENVINQYLLLLKKNKILNLTYKHIKSGNFTFDNKLDFLNGKKLISVTHYSKMKSVKWDRNLYGHNSRVKPKDASAMVIIGLYSIEYLDYKIQKLKKLLNHKRINS